MLCESAGTDVFRAAVAEEILPRGGKVALILGYGEGAVEGRRVVAGVVAGYAVRSSQYVDVMVRGIRTWPYGQMAEVEALDPAFEAVFKIAVQGTIQETLLVLRRSSSLGRGRLPAAEIPYRSCPYCGLELERSYPYCGGCGKRVLVGPDVSRSPTAPRKDDPVARCLGCWLPTGRKTRFCEHCGFEHHAKSWQTLQGQTVHLQLTLGRTRVGRIEARVVKAAYRRIYRTAGPMLVLQIGAVRMSGKAAEVLPEAFTTWVAVGAREDAPDEMVASLLRGTVLRASEVPTPCSACMAEGRRGRVRTRHCPSCGARQRIQPLTEVRASRRRRGPARHACGHVLGKRDRFCPGCGEVAIGALLPNHGMEGRWAELVGPVAAPIAPPPRRRPARFADLL